MKQYGIMIKVIRLVCVFLKCSLIKLKFYIFNERFSSLQLMCIFEVVNWVCVLQVIMNIVN